MKNKKGFTLVELLAVIVILAVLLLVAVPAITNLINNTRFSADRSEAEELIKQLDTCYLVNSNCSTVYEKDANDQIVYETETVNGRTQNKTFEDGTSIPKVVTNPMEQYLKGKAGIKVYVTATYSEDTGDVSITQFRYIGGNGYTFKLSSGTCVGTTGLVDKITALSYRGSTDNKTYEFSC